MAELSILNPPAPNVAGLTHWECQNASAHSLLLAELLKRQSVPTLIVAEDQAELAKLHEEISFYLHDRKPLITFGDWETLPYDHFSPHQDIISDRLLALSRLPHLTQGGIITTLSTLMQPLASPSFLDAYAFNLQTGDTLHMDVLRTRLTEAGYYHVSEVQEHGEFAIRGAIIDIYPMGSNEPIRIELFDNEIDTLRFFSPDTQRSGEVLESIRLLPAKEYPIHSEAIEKFRANFRGAFPGNPTRCAIYQDISEGIFSPGIEYYLPLFFDQTSRFFDYLPKNTQIILVGNTQEKTRAFYDEVQFRYQQGKGDITRPLLPPDVLFLTPEKLNEHLSQYPCLLLNNKLDAKKISFSASPAPSVSIHASQHEPLKTLVDFIKSYGGQILFSVETLGRREALLNLFKPIHLEPKPIHHFDEFIHSSDKIGMMVAPLDSGFELKTPPIVVITEAELTGRRVMQRRLRKKTTVDPENIIRDLTELQLNDPIVHFDHGVGRYRGLQTLTVNDQISEFLTLEYEGGDKLYVPVGSLHLISRYSGADADHAPMHRLGNEQWSRAKRKAAAKVKDVAAELLDLYAKRAVRPGEKYRLHEDQYAAFCTGFPFEETPDQLTAIQSVFNDLASDKPMDRVVCGDVGFGKTEVAMRAAFMAVTNHKQVIVLVPTTLLAEQHFRLFQDRFADWPVKVECLSRFRTAKQQLAILDELKEGKMDIVIGTHKLLQQNVAIKNLGLVIIDEEHRFGVKQKEKLKSLRTNVDILTLTATPIPRTLNMALVGIRDLSLMATPPQKRLSVKTFVHETQNSLIQEAIQREILRGGQVYFLHNDVATIDKKAHELNELVQEARVVAAHGQLHERELERIMSDFYHRRFNVLVCSTIIESGIDIPTANTIIINRADKFGIAQLHQLRGRVGRSHHQAYAYLLTPPKQQLTSDAIKRLDAIAAFDDLGIGFTLATHDLEIRGAGEMLGESQSGDMHEVGFDLYMDLLSRAVSALKQGMVPNLDTDHMPKRTEIDCHLTALIPESYLGDIQLRLQFYKRIANAENETDLFNLQVEMVDRFGLLPEALKHLFAISELKLMAVALGILKMDVNAKGAKIEFSDAPSIKPETLIQLLQQKNSPYQLDGPTKLKVMLPPHQPNERIELTQTILKELSS